jgi:hypothetical protein
MAEPLCEFELERKANIARNRERMKARARGRAQPQHTTLFSRLGCCCARC